MTEFMSSYAAGVAPQWGASASPRTYRYAPTFEAEPRYPWMEAALCRETDPEIFFPEKGGSTKSAKAVCLNCPSRSSCLAWALEGDERFGVLGGLSERERRALKKSRTGDAA